MTYEASLGGKCLCDRDGIFRGAIPGIRLLFLKFARSTGCESSREEDFAGAICEWRINCG